MITTLFLWRYVFHIPGIIAGPSSGNSEFCIIDTRRRVDGTPVKYETGGPRWSGDTVWKTELLKQLIFFLIRNNTAKVL